MFTLFAIEASKIQKQTTKLQMTKGKYELTVLTEATDRLFSFFLLLDLPKMFPEMNEECRYLNLKAPITTAADDKFFDIFPNFRKNKVRYFMRIVCQQTILMKYHALFVIFENAAKFLIVVCCKL